MSEQPDQVMARITTAIEQSHAGEATAAAAAFDTIWSEIGGEDGDPFHRCVLAHYAADVQPDPADELAWDLRALAAANEFTADTDERARAYHASLQVQGFFPSLHLNLAEDYRKLGDPAQAREHLRLARERLHHLAVGPEGYADTIRTALARVEQDLAAG
ncbi:hypothetical protein [Pseudonocardia asaccharolytica]|uniref:Tetratricopeptide repeat protein n=1 Tax=Pseudonocardia asaccharolytica DSM 44247 = NBRC 16224 TaxID=1123024 RepID=A0A511CZ49_9PSEU|nr:hypothetical protein [Pseudonocardia asaccharolytica]GEL17543.1 hypothetical protein PA7_13800 [Pseudonocardia asaccharolytica DSM 44247 = NBRC 16224]